MPARLQEQLSVVGAALSRGNTVTTTIMRGNQPKLSTAI